MTELVTRRRKDLFKSGTVEELVEWCLRRDMEPATVTVVCCRLRFESPETPDEATRRINYHAENKMRHAAWERAMYGRLRESFDVDLPSLIQDPSAVRSDE